MAKTKHTGAKLSNNLYPIFPDDLGKLRQIQQKTNLNYVDLVSIGRSMPGFLLASKPTTSDDYNWYCGLFFATDLGRIAILFPWAQDSKMIDEDDADRSIAVYITGYVDVDDFVSQFIKAVNEFSKSR